MKFRLFFNAGIGTASTQFLSLLTLPFLTRLYAPAEFAPWALSLAFVIFIGSISTLRYDLALLTERQIENSSALFWLIFLISAVICISVTSAMFISLWNGWQFLETKATGLTWLVAFWLFLFTQNVVWNAWNLHHGAFLAISVSQLLNASIMYCVQFYGAMLHGGGSLWLVIGSLSGLCAGLLVLIISGCRTNLRPKNIIDAFPSFGESAWRHRRFVQYSLPYTLFGAVRDRLPILLVGFWTTSKELGLYSQAWRLSNVPAALSGSAIRPVVLRHALNHGFTALETYIERILYSLVILGTPFLAILVLLHEEIFSWLLGEHWSAIGPYFAALAFPAMTFSLSNWMDRLVDTAAGKQHVNLWTELISGVSSILGLLIVLSLGGSLFQAVVIQSALLTLNYLFFIYLTFYIVGFKRVILIKLLLLSVLLFVCTYLLINTFTS